MSYVSGPVPSRRLGRSLGVDLVPFKTCTYDCIYCQLGQTTNKTLERREWVPLGDVVAELKEKLSSRPDYITLSGSGVPTLYSRIDELIGRVRSMTSTPIAVLTNGSLLWQEEVRRPLMDAHLVVPPLDAGDRLTFSVVNRPHSGVTCEEMLDGLVAFRTVTRPPAEDYAMAVDRQRLGELAALEHRRGKFVLADRSEGLNGREVSICQDDIDNVITAKAAILAAAKILLDRLDLKPSDIDRLFVAGGFGNDIDLANAVAIGLLPDLPPSKTLHVGNTSIWGAKLAALSGEARQALREITERTTYCDLLGAEDHVEQFQQARFLPHTDVELFPSAVRQGFATREAR